MTERTALSALAALERPAATARDLIPRFHMSRQAANLTLSRLARKGWLRRLRRGAYAIVPLSSASAMPVVEDPLAVAMELYAPCYISGWTAAQHWGLTEQIHNSVVVYSVKPQRQSGQQIGGVAYRIRRIPGNTIFGTIKVWSGTVAVQMATVHRTVIDVLDAPEMGGGGRQTLDIMRAYWRRAEADPEALLDRVEAVAGVADPLDGRDRHAVDRDDRPQAGVDRAAHDTRAGAVPLRQHHRAGAATTLAAAELRTGKPARPQVIDEQERRIRVLERDARPVDEEDDLGARRVGRRHGRRAGAFGTDCHRATPLWLLFQRFTMPRLSASSVMPRSRGPHDRSR